MTDLESKNPQLKELGDLIYGRVLEPSPRIEQEASPSPSPRSQDDSPVTAVVNFISTR
jgi:hypothetical protein